jgi:hypothetical protein
MLTAVYEQTEGRLNALSMYLLVDEEEEMREEGDLNPRALSSTGCLPLPRWKAIAIQRLAGLGHPRLICA